MQCILSVVVAERYYKLMEMYICKPANVFIPHPVRQHVMRSRFSGTNDLVMIVCR